MQEVINTTYKILVPIRVKLLEFFNGIINEIPEILHELVQNSGKFLLPLEEGKYAALSFEVLEADVNSPQLQELVDISKFADYTFFKIQTQLTHEKITIYRGYKGEETIADDLSETELIELSKRYYADILIKGVSDLVIASNIAKPGILRTEPGFIYIDERKYTIIPEIHNALYEAIVHTKHIGWPKLHNLSILAVWEWLRTIPYYFDGIGKHPIGRALAAFSYLFGHFNIDEPFSRALWAILGLEALYGDDNVGIQKQLVERTEAFLGKRSSYCKIINQMYAFRSRFLHGDINFPIRHTFFEGTSEVEEFMEDSFIPEQFAQIVLVATLQEMARRNLTELKFEVSFVQSIK